ncbi:hypothetical protein FB451DRAFT_1178046 [Mycena latifolia]|nr:hypothetical protein FB451DRAFT_1178046 [Mycena latifolia]
MDILFGETCRDQDSRHDVWRGKYRMDLVVKYFRDVEWGEIPADFKSIKFPRLVTELKVLAVGAIGSLCREKRKIQDRAQARALGSGLGLEISDAQARLSQAQARASRPSRGLNITKLLGSKDITRNYPQERVVGIGGMTGPLPSAMAILDVFRSTMEGDLDAIASVLEAEASPSFGSTPAVDEKNELR